MRKSHFLILAMCLAVIFSACKEASDDITNITYAVSGTREEKLNFESRAIPFIESTDDNVTDTLHVRIYDGNEYLPYVGVKYFLTKWCDAEVSEMDYNNGSYTIMAEALKKKFPLVVNNTDNTIYCPSWAVFTGLDPSADLTENTSLLKANKAFTGQRAVTFDFGKYGFEIYGGLDDAYIPLCVANQLFLCTMNMKHVLYNGVNLYNYTEAEKYETFKNSPWYSDLKNRPQQLIDISYNLLCFNHDYLYGKPGYYGFADNGAGYAYPDKVAAADALSFDQMLSQYDPETKTLLKASSYGDYLKGIFRLTINTYGDQHAGVRWRDFLWFQDSDPEIQKGLATIEKSKKWEYDSSRSAKLHELRVGAGIEDVNGLKEDKYLQLIDGGKTLIVRFDAFQFDESGWLEWYKNIGNLNTMVYVDPENPDYPVPKENDEESVTFDTIGLFYRVFYYLNRDKTAGTGEYKDVKTILIDDSLNSGGVKITMQWVLALLTGNGDLTYDDAHTNSKYHEYAKADLDLDGKINKDDADCSKFIMDNYNIAILCSYDAFSCGNALPYFAKERGIKILGERTGGGSCVVGYGVTADGFPFNYSINQRLCSKDFSETVEGGAIPDKTLEYEAFYDTADDGKLVQALKELFGDDY